VASKRHRTRLGFTVFVALGILGLLVLDGAAAGATLLVAMLVFIFTCVYALRSEDPAAVKHNERTGLAGWIGGWF
jgi:hypothetical protein